MFSLRNILNFYLELKHIGTLNLRFLVLQMYCELKPDKKVAFQLFFNKKIHEILVPTINSP